MKAISLWQPWASLMASGYKRIETRGWPTKYRGPLLIHAAKKIIDKYSRYRVREACLRYGHDPYMQVLPYGAIICRVDLIDCWPAYGIYPCPNGLERDLGDYDSQRFMWITDNLITFKPIQFRGAQGFFNVPDELLEAEYE